jgi:hypothetical protein
MTRVFLTVAATLAVAGSVATAEADDRPTLSVLPFTASRSALSAQDAAELADDLATRLVETGRFRVLPREWLPTPAEDVGALAESVSHEAARQTGVGYLLAVSVTGLTAGRPSAPPAILTAGRAMLALGGARRPPLRCPPGRPPQPSFVSVQARVINVASGAVVTTSVARVRLGTSLATTALGTGCGGGGAALAAPSRPDVDSLKRANADIASTLALPQRAPRLPVD